MNLSSEIYIVISDILLFTSGILVGGLIILFRLAIRLPKVFISPHTKGTKANFVQIKDDDTGKEMIYANPESFKQSLQLLSTIAKWNLDFSQKSVMLGDDKKEHRLFCCYILIWVIAISIAIYNLITIQT